MSLFGFLPGAGSANLAVRRHAFEALGGFAEDLMTGEDFDLSWRSQLSGHRFVVNADAVVPDVVDKVSRRYLADLPLTEDAAQSSSVDSEPMGSGATGYSGEDVDMADSVNATAHAARISRSLGTDRRMENWLPCGIGTTESPLPLRDAWIPISGTGMHFFPIQAASSDSRHKASSRVNCPSYRP